MKLLLLILVFSSLSCAAYVPTGAIVECEAEDASQCPPDVDCQLSIFADSVPGFDVHSNLTIEWYGIGDGPIIRCDSARGIEDKDGDGICRAGGLTPSGSLVQTAGQSYLSHELVHVQLRRVFNDGDVNHERNPGEWRTTYNDLARDLRIQMREECWPEFLEEEEEP